MRKQETRTPSTSYGDNATAGIRAASVKCAPLLRRGIFTKDFASHFSHLLPLVVENTCIHEKELIACFSLSLLSAWQ